MSEQHLDPNLAQQDDASSLCWYDIQHLNVEGKGWTDTDRYYDRLSARAKGTIREPVWNLSRSAAGLCVPFTTSAPAIHARWTVTARESLAMPHMPATGVSGLDLYVQHTEDQWRWVGVGRPEFIPTNTAQLVGGIPPGTHTYHLYLPLYTGVTSVEIGIPKDCVLLKPDPETRNPLVFYGTSITQGGCASRPGMVHTAILGRRLNWPVINLGFSGNGRMEPELADLLAELDPAVYILDCLPNMEPTEVAERAAPFVRTLRTTHPNTPIVLVEDRTYCDAFFIAARQKRNTDSRAALKAAYETLLSEGVQHLHYLPGATLLGSDGEATVDGSHPTDLGFVRQADAFEPVLRPLVS